MTRQSYWNYIEVISIEHVPEQNNRTNTNKFRTYIKHRNKDNSTIPGLYISKAVSSLIPNRSIKISEQEFRAEQIMKTKPSQAANDIYIMNYGLHKLLEVHLNPHKAAGPDGIKATSLKELSK